VIKRDIVVIGSSAGGVEALTRIFREIPSDFAGSFFIAHHLWPEAVSVLPMILTNAGPLAAVHPADGEKIHPRVIYVAPPDVHMKVEPGRVRVTKGPRENRHRPAVDPLFRSASLAYGPRVAGVILTGSLDDGTAGLMAVKRRGGVAIVQDPEEAQFQGMPESALRNVKVDYVLRIAEIPSLLTRLARGEEAVDGIAQPAPGALQEEKISELDMTQMERDDHPGTPSTYACPECSGTLWELLDGDLLRFRCRIGHAYTADVLAIEQHEGLERALWIALRALEENVSLHRRIAAQARDRGDYKTGENHEEEAEQKSECARVIRDALQQS
jgi:two-component system chemotaxis response regulator CheB